MNWFRKKRPEMDNMPKRMTPSEFLSYATQFIHFEAAKWGYAKKGFILNEGLISIGNPFIAEGLISEQDISKRTNSFFLSLATSNLQTGVILARALCTNRQKLISGEFFDEHESIESMYNELLVALKEDLHVSIQQWEEFREFIVPKMLTMLEPFTNLPNFEEYREKAVSAYYLLGVSIGLEKHEP